MSLLIYPQLRTGALAQFPIRRRSRTRTVVNALADGSTVKLADTAGRTTEWSLPYEELADDEIAELEQFFANAEGTLSGFTFVDPMANLLEWSGQLTQAVWQRGPLLTVASGLPDPAGGSQAWHLANTGERAQAISQTPGAPGDYLYCLSAYVRANAATAVTMLVGNSSAERMASAAWSRIVFAAVGDAGANSMGFGLEIPAGASVDVFGLQAEPQASASGYRESTQGGVYTNARLRDDELTVTTTGVNRHSCTVNIIHVNHL